MNRRAFLKNSLVSTAGWMWTLGSHRWVFANPSKNGNKRLIVIFLRGAVDGLNVVIPYAEMDYYDGRPTIAVAPPGSGTGALQLDGYFGLHPALGNLMPLWNEKKLAFVHACGSPDPTRSHFDAQDYMETGTPGVKTTSDGWMNRLLATLPGPHSPTQAMSFSPTLPRILSGPMPTTNEILGPRADKPIPLDRPVVAEAFDSLYDGDDDISRAYREAQVARKQILSDLEKDMQQADNGAPGPKGLVDTTVRLGRLLREDGGIQLAFIGLGGWDTHINQGGVQGQLANHLQQLGAGLMALVQTLGASFDDTVILVMSEFGRTVHENGNAGTDHGHGNVMWLLGGGVRGGRIYGEWPGLNNEALFQGRDLAVTTDFRNVIARVLERHFRLGDSQLRTVFPHLPGSPTHLSELLAA